MVLIILNESGFIFQVDGNKKAQHSCWAAFEHSGFILGYHINILFQLVVGKIKNPQPFPTEGCFLL